MPEPLTITAAAILLPYTAFAWPRSRMSMLGSDTAASIQQVAFVAQPTGVTTMAPDIDTPAAGTLDGRLTESAGWMEMAHAVFADTRPMADWEREALDEFTWSELRS